jgi:DNA-binding transcriptional LysR family regulator
LRLFVRVAERHSVSRAADDLAIPQPTASRWLANLEDDYGQALLRRSTRQIALTDAGEKFLAYAREALDRELALRQALASSGKGWQGRLTIAAPSSFGTNIVLPAIAAFQRDHRDLVFDLRLSDAYSDVVAEGVDIAVRIGRLSDSQLVVTRIAELAEIIVCHPELVAGIDRNDARQVERLPWIRFSGLRDGQTVPIERGDTHDRLNIVPRLWVNSVAALRQAILDRGGASLIHAYAMASDIETGDAVRLLPRWRLPMWPVNLVFPAGRRDPRAAAFAAHLKRYVRSAVK